MTQTVQAIFENGVLKPLEKLDLSEHSRVQVTVETAETAPANGQPPIEDPLAGLCVSTGVSDLAERFDDYRPGRRIP